ADVRRRARRARARTRLGGGAVKTGELFVEQVLIGALLLATGVLPWAPEIMARVADKDTSLALVAAATLLGTAYVLGILGDRVADTLTESLDQHHRLRFALARLLVDGGPAARLQPPEQAPWRDPFREDRLRLTVLRDAGPVVAWLDYHRSRARVARALAVWMPALTLSAVIAGARFGAASGI